MEKYILVAGVEYFHFGTNYGLLCKKRMRQIVNNSNQSRSKKFIIFDFASGTVEEFTSVNGNIDNGTITQQFEAITRGKYGRIVRGRRNPYAFLDMQRNVLSILDVYDEIIRIGNTAPNSLMELSFFSHAKNEGPILVNSYDDGIYGVHDEYRRMSYVIDLPAPARDPDDKDARHDKDFREPTLPPRERRSFENAFSQDAEIRIWGCTTHEDLRVLIRKIIHNRSYRGKNTNGDSNFHLTQLNPKQTSILKEFFNPLRLPPSDFRIDERRGEIHIKFKYIKYFFCLLSMNTYAYQIANATKTKVFAALYGNGARYNPKDGLFWIIEDLSFINNFYKDILGFEIDEKRNYGIYLPDSLICT